MWIAGRYPPAFIPTLDCPTFGAIFFYSRGFRLYLFALQKATLLNYSPPQNMSQGVLPVLGEQDD